MTHRDDNVAIDLDLAYDLMFAPKAITPDRLAATDEAAWDRLLARAAEHRVLPLIRANIGLLPPPGLPASVASRLDAHHRRATMRQLKISAETIRISTLLDESEVPHIFLKGLPLANVFYPQPVWRPMRDIDILVPKTHLERAWNCLVAHGGEMDRFAENTVARPDTDKHLRPLWSPSRAIGVEIHQHLHTRSISPQALGAYQARVWERRTSFELAGRRLPSPSAEDLLIHITIHALYDHDLNNGPLFIADIRALLDRGNLDWNLVDRECEALGITAGMDLARRLAADVSSPEARRRDGIIAVALRLMMQDLEFRVAMRYQANWSQMSWRERGAYLLGRFTIPRETLRMHHHDAGLPRWMRHLYPLLWVTYVVSRTGELMRSSRATETESILRDTSRLRSDLGIR